MADYVILIIAVIGFIANAIKRAKAASPPPDSRALQPPPYPMQPQAIGKQQPVRQPSLAVSPASPGNRIISSAAQPLAGAPRSQAGRPLAGAPQAGRIVSQTPMSNIAQQFAKERAASDRQMAAAADQARMSSDQDPLQASRPKDTAPRVLGASESAQNSESTRARRRAPVNENYLLNGIIFAQILSPPLCKNKQRSICTVPDVRQ